MVPSPLTPTLQKELDQFGDWQRFTYLGPEIPAARPLWLRRGGHTLRQEQVATERFEHVLPGSNRKRIAHDHAFTPTEGSNHVADDAISGPVTPTDDVACPCRCQ